MKRYTLVVLSKNEIDYQQPIKTWRCYDLDHIKQLKDCVSTCLSLSGYISNEPVNIEKLNNKTVYTETITFTHTQISTHTLSLSILYFTTKHFTNILQEDLNDGGY